MSSDDEETEFWDELKCYRAPTGLSESDGEEAGELQLTLLHELPTHSPQHQAALQLAMQLQQSLLLKYQQDVRELELKGADLDAAEAGQLLGLESWLADKQGELSKQEAAALEALKESRARKLAALLSENKLQALQQKKAVEEALAQRAYAEQKRQEGEAKRMEVEQRRQKQKAEYTETKHEAERKAAEQKQEQEAQAAARAAEAAAQRKQEKTQQQQQQQQSAASPQQHQQQSAASPQQHQQQAGPASSGGAAAMAGTTAAAGRVEVTAASLLRIADSARAAEEQAWEVLSRARESVKPLVESKNPDVRKQRREIEQEVTVRLNQITSVQEQIDRKATDLLKLLAQQQQQELRTYAYLVLAKRMMSQCEAQISQNPTSCFAYGATLSIVAAEHPDLAHLLVANVHQVCPLAVPKYYEERSGAQALYLQEMKYKMLPPDPKHGRAARERPESADGYLSRMQGYLLFYAAFTMMQPPRGSHPHGIDHAWMYVARLLNSLPANRIVATALHIFLKAAGHCLALKYGRQFNKLLGYVKSAYLPDLAQGQDANVEAAGTRLQAYLNSQSHRRAPEGYEMPRFDRSAN